MNFRKNFTPQKFLAIWYAQINPFFIVSDFFDFKTSTLFSSLCRFVKRSNSSHSRPESLPAVSNLLPFDIIVLSLLKCQWLTPPTLTFPTRPLIWPLNIGRKGLASWLPRQWPQSRWEQFTKNYNNEYVPRQVSGSHKRHTQTMDEVTMGA